MQLIRHAATAAIITTVTLLQFSSPISTAAQEATPATYTCETAMHASPMAGMDGMAMGTPSDGGHDMTGQTVEFDRMYIDMMIPHHASIIALAQAAHDRLTDERLRTMSDNIITAQQAEIEELRGYRAQWYGSSESMPMDESMMGMMAEMMPGMGEMAEMDMLMDAETLVSAFCGAEEPDLAFIELTIPHHEMAIRSSEAALAQATHDEIRAIAERVIQDQQREIDELEAIRSELTGGGTPAS